MQAFVENICIQFKNYIKAVMRRLLKRMITVTETHSSRKILENEIYEQLVICQMFHSSNRTSWD